MRDNRFIFSQILTLVAALGMVTLTSPSAQAASCVGVTTGSIGKCVWSGGCTGTEEPARTGSACKSSQSETTGLIESQVCCIPQVKSIGPIGSDDPDPQPIDPPVGDDPDPLPADPGDGPVNDAISCGSLGATCFPRDISCEGEGGTVRSEATDCGTGTCCDMSSVGSGSCTNSVGEIGSCIRQGDVGSCNGTPYNSSAIEAACGEGKACCVAGSDGSGSGGNNQGTSCSVIVGGTNRSGICEFGDMCSSGVASPTCTGRTLCCPVDSGGDGSGTGGGNNQGTACSRVVNGSNRTGVCEFPDLCSNAANRVISPTCIGTICCLTGTGSGSDGTTTTTPGTGVSGGNCPSGTYEKIAGVCFPKNTGLSGKSVAEIIGTLLSWLLAMFGVLALIGFVISGGQYLFATGDEHMAETAKRNMQYCIIGIIVALSGFIIIKAVDTLLRANVLI